jgi:hypothetical protein
LTRLFHHFGGGGSFGLGTFFFFSLGAGGSFSVALLALFDFVFFALALPIFFAGFFVFGALQRIVSLARFGGAQGRHTAFQFGI